MALNLPLFLWSKGHQVIVPRFKTEIMKKLIPTSIALIVLLTLVGPLYGQAVRNGVERSQDRNQIQKDKSVLQRDQAELKQFAANQRGLYQAVDNDNHALARGFRTKLVAGMQREIAQGEAKIKQSQREVVQSKAEVNSSGREVRNTRGTGRPVATADDRRDKKDDQRDLQDDKNDARELKARNARQKEILAVFKSIKINGPADFPAIRGKRAMLEEFEVTMRRDMGENREELVEDKQELKEDQRETREDRRQR